MPKPIAKWEAAEAERAAECERKFQNGGTRVYGYEADGRGPLASGHTADRTFCLAFPGMTVYARRKVAGRYSWVRAVRTADVDECASA